MRVMGVCVVINQQITIFKTNNVESLYALNAKYILLRLLTIN